MSLLPSSGLISTAAVNAEFGTSLVNLDSLLTLINSTTKTTAQFYNKGKPSGGLYISNSSASALSVYTSQTANNIPGVNHLLYYKQQQDNQWDLWGGPYTTGQSLLLTGLSAATWYDFMVKVQWGTTNQYFVEIIQSKYLT